MIDWLGPNLSTLKLICLDHDLGPNQIRDGTIFDPGTGRDVADFLASSMPICPAVIHTTNWHAEPGMRMVLDDADWQVTSIAPYDDLRWISEASIDEIKRVLSAGS